jgi:hypothetical protein
MKADRSIEEKVERALESLEHVRRASPGEFFFTRVQARLQQVQRNTWERISSFLARPAIAAIAIFVVLLANGFIIYEHSLQNDSPVAEVQTLVNDEYNMELISLYDSENLEP